MLRSVDSCSILPSVHYATIAFRLVRCRLPTDTTDIESAPPTPATVSHSPTLPTATAVPAATQPKAPLQTMAPSSDQPRSVPNLISGARMSTDQEGTFHKLVKLVEATWQHKQPQTSTKDANAIAGATIAHEHRSFFTSECIRRYLVSRQFCEKKAYEMIMSTLHWRSVNVPAAFDPAAFTECTSSRFMEWQGYDSGGRPTLYMKSANADLKISRDQRVTFTVVTLEKGITIMGRGYSGHTGVEQWNIVVDETGRESKHTDSKFLSHIAPILTSHYAQRLHRCYVVNPGLMTRMIYGIVKMFLDEGTTSKIKMVSSKKDKQKGGHYVPELLEDIGAANIPPEYGGTLPPRLLEEYRAYFNAIPLK